MKKVILMSLVLSFTYSAFSQVKETGLMKSWPAEGPQMILKVGKIGKGYSSPVVANQTIYVTGMIDTLDYLTAIDFQGKIKWQVPYGRSWSKSFPETRSTPTVEGDRVYVVGGLGRLVCIDANSGKERWAVDVDKDFKAEWHLWGVSESPLIVDDKVICTPGGKETSVVAFNKITGKLVWKSESVGGQRAYASPTIFEYKNFRFILAVTATHLIALNPGNGSVAWSYKYYQYKLWSDQPGLIWTNTPVFKNDEIFLSMGYDYPAVMLKMDSLGTSVSEKWTDHTLDNHHHGVLVSGDYMYGSNWKSNGKGKWVCMNWDTGEVEYVTDWINKGALIGADDLFYVYEEKTGTVGLIKPNPEKWEVISTFKVTDGTGPHWAHPFISNGKLYLRHGEVLMVYNIKA
ncbi:MAG: PQQ-like beta-propeller repeat protein [Bacteroidia bacterium]|nr:PQQ-like beta-propeller repeat protein [Bacteroidia bacterium]